MTETPPATGRPDGAAPRANLPELTVSELSQALKRSIEERFSYVRVRGEVSGFKRHSSGHLYLALKDADALIDAVCWRGSTGKLQVKPEDGLEVVCTGRLTTYPGRSKYQLVIESMELAGVGALLKMLEERKQRLAAEGLFAAERKKPIPFLPDVIGVITSPTGAVIRDILHRLSDRFPRHVLLWPVAVQGDTAAAQVAAAIAGFNALPVGGRIPRPDVLIVARGGGSIEDLMAFNEEIVVRAAAASAIPLISAVGHETDTTLIDLASDQRAPTPTAAAEMAVPVRLDLMADLAGKSGRLDNALGRLFTDRRVRLEGLARGLPRPQGLLDTARQTLDERTERLGLAAGKALAERHQRLDLAARGLDRSFGHFVALEARRFAGVAARLGRDGLDLVVGRSAERADEWRRRLDAAWAAVSRTAQQRLDLLSGRLASHRLSHDNILERGYAMVEGAGGRIIIAAREITAGAALRLHFSDGTVAATADGGGGGSDGGGGMTPEAKPTEAPKPKASKPSRALPRALPEQGKLL